MQPALAGQADLGGEKPAENHGSDGGRNGDGVQKLAFHHLEGGRRLGMRRRHRMIDEQARAIEQTGHPGDDRDDMQDQHPAIPAHHGAFPPIGQTEQTAGQTRPSSPETIGPALSNAWPTSSARA